MTEQGPGIFDDREGDETYCTCNGHNVCSFCRPSWNGYPDINKWPNNEGYPDYLDDDDEGDFYAS